MLQGRLLIIISPQSTTALQFSWVYCWTEATDFKETLWSHNDPVEYKQQHETAV